MSASTIGRARRSATAEAAQVSKPASPAPFRALMTEQMAVIDLITTKDRRLLDNMAFGELLVAVRKLNTVLAKSTAIADHRQSLAQIAAICEAWDKQINPVHSVHPRP